MKLTTVSIATLVAALCAATPASAVTLTRADGSTPIPRLQSWVDKAPVPTLPGVVRVTYGATHTHYLPATRTIRVGPQPLIKEALFHELGHDLERYGLTAAGWNQWAAATGETRPRDAADTVPIGRGHDDDDGLRWVAIERFAEWFAGCATRGGVWRRAGADVIDRYGQRMLHAAARATCSRIFRLHLHAEPTRNESGFQ